MRQLTTLWLLDILFIQLCFCATKQLDNCKYKNDKIHIFDFGNLSETKSLKHHDPDEEVYFRLCKSLEKPCNGINNVGACLYKKDKEIFLGHESKFEETDGKMQFSYTGEHCKNNSFYTLTITMMCDYKVTNSTPEIIPYAHDSCGINVIWRTISACGANAAGLSEPLGVNCTVTSNTGEYYDLSDLTKYSENYIIPGDKDSTLIIVNVCFPVIFGNSAVCPYNSGVCLRNSKTMSYETIGDVQPPTIEDNELAIVYKPGKQLHEEGFTKITFVCDPDQHNSSPTFLKAENDLYYYLSWRTPAACPKKVNKTSTTNSCTAINQITKFQYNLEPLMNKDYIVQSPEAVQYKVRICAPLKSQACRLSGQNADAGVCSGNKTIGGKANSNFMWSRDGATGPYLNYTDGSSCGNNSNRFTIIAFECQRDESKNILSVKEDKNCHISIQWNTSLVCEENAIPWSPPKSEIKEKPTIHNTNTKRNEVHDEPTALTSPTPSTTIPTTTTTKSNSEDATTDSRTAYVFGVALSILLATCGTFVISYLLSSRFRGCINSCCCSRCFSRSDIRMQYSKINTGPEMDSLLDAPDTLCQSEDSDDDLLRI